MQELDTSSFVHIAYQTPQVRFVMKKWLKQTQGTRVAWHLLFWEVISGGREFLHALRPFIYSTTNLTPCEMK